MNQILIKRAVKKQLVNELCRFLVFRYISKKNQEYASKRGQRMALYANDHIGLSIYIDGIYEKEEINDVINLMSILKIDTSKGVAIDIGANIGNHTIIFSKIFGYVFSFEPNPFTFQILNFNSQFLLNVKTFNFGLSDKNEKLELFEDISNYGASSAVYKKSESRSTTIEVRSLDSMEENFSNLKLMKIDVEGMEYDVLRGAKNIIEKNKPIILFEQHMTDFDENESNSIRFLRDLDYEICWVNLANSTKPWVVRRILNFFELIFFIKINRRIVTATKVPSGYYSMLIGVPKYYLRKI